MRANDWKLAELDLKAKVASYALHVQLDENLALGL
jgi:hypothetical protein